MSEFRRLTDAELEHAYEAVFKEAFPPAELKPLWAMREMIENGIYDAMGLFEGGKAQGFVCLWREEPEGSSFVLMDYLCVPKNARNGGLGARLIKASREHYPPDTVIIGEAEAPVGEPLQDGLIMRRLAFYERSGAKIIGYNTALFGVCYKTIVWANHTISDELVLERHKSLYKSRLGEEEFKKYIQIPLNPGALPHPPSPWTEIKRGNIRDEHSSI